MIFRIHISLGWYFNPSSRVHSPSKAKIVQRYDSSPQFKNFFFLSMADLLGFLLTRNKGYICWCSLQWRFFFTWRPKADLKSQALPNSNFLPGKVFKKDRHLFILEAETEVGWFLLIVVHPEDLIPFWTSSCQDGRGWKAKTSVVVDSKHRSSF